MFNFIASLILASFLIPQGFDFLTQKAAGYFYPKTQNQESIEPSRIVNNSLGIETTAKSVLAVDKSSGAILFSKNHYEILPIASITKLMTAIIFLENNPGFDQKVTITKEDQRSGGMVYLVPGEEVTVKDLFYLTLVASSNEAAAALARSTGLPDFVGKMNGKAFELGMYHTDFVDSTGLNPNNTSNPSDLVRLANAAFSMPEIISATTMKEYDFTVLNNRRLGRAVNTDKLLDSFLNSGSYHVAGAKTGYLDEAGYCLVTEINKIDGQNVTLVLLDSVSQVDRWQEAKGVIDWIFDNYQWPKQ